MASSASSQPAKQPQVHPSKHKQHDAFSKASIRVKFQPYYFFQQSDARWHQVDPHGSRVSEREAPGSVGNNNLNKTERHAPATLRIITWNIDFKAPEPQARMAAALAHLETIIEQTPASTAAVIMLQELVQSRSLDLSQQFHQQRQHTASNNPQTQQQLPRSFPNDLGQLAAAPWIQERFHVTDLTTSHWSCSYNSVTLVDRRLKVADVARLPFRSRFGREALVVDVVVLPQRAQATHERSELEDPQRRSQENISSHKAEPRQVQESGLLRLCNVHLDSLAGAPPMRPGQWRLCAQYLQNNHNNNTNDKRKTNATDDISNVIAGIVAGDCNAIQDFDATLPEENGFKDAYLEISGQQKGGNDESWGFTWGFQSKRTQFAPSRMDKICYCQGMSTTTNGLQSQEEDAVLRLKKLERIGVGVRVDERDEAARRGLDRKGYFDFATDHYGLMAEFELGEPWVFET